MYLKYRVTDNVSPKVNVVLRITNPKGSIKNITLNNRTKGTTYSCKYTAPTLTGRYKYQVIAKDHAGWPYQTSGKYFKVVK